MTRETVDFGIDLGTTTSIVATTAAGDSTVIRNNRQADHTPSAVYVSKSNKVLVGQPAKDRVEEDPDNAIAEFKLQMGKTDMRKEFHDAGRTMTPEELSAEVLKSLRGDVRQALGESIDAAVITVPAAFELDQCDATRRAAALAGLDFAPLIQEPSAAAWAYSGKLATERGFWLVYDFGGGTFDAAVVRVGDGEFSTVNHAGDNFLGGKLIDWDIVDRQLVPAARRDFPLPDLARGHRASAGNIAKLKAAAEYAKIALSRADTAEISVRLNDDNGRPAFDFEYELDRATLERIATPFYERSISLCRKAIAEAGVRPDDIERVLLVGGTTFAPSLREMLADAETGLGIPLDHSIDPVTVVAKGAAIFAGTQRRPARAEHIEQALGDGRVVLNLEYSSAGSDIEPLVGGLPPRATREMDWQGATIEFSRPDGKPPWSSGRIPLTAQGTFTTRLRADEQTTNTYAVELRDAKGTQLATEPDRITYRHATTMGTAPTLSHSIGIALSNNEVKWLVRKGSELPAKARAIVSSVVTVRRAESSGLIRVPIVEGERDKADRNTLIGQLDIVPDEVDRDVPAGSEVEVELRIDTSFAPTADAYVPVLDEEFPITVELGRSDGNANFDAETDDVAARYETLLARVDRLRDEPAAAHAVALSERFEDGTVAELRRLAGAAKVDPDAAATCQNRLREARTALDDLEAELSFPERAREIRDMLNDAGDMVAELGGSADRSELGSINSAVEKAIAEKDRTQLDFEYQRLARLARKCLDRSGALEPSIFASYSGALSGNGDPQVRQLLSRGQHALTNGDQAALASINQQLSRYVPRPESGGRGEPGSGGLGSTVGLGR